MTLRPRDRVAIVAVLVLALVGAYYMLALKPERQKVKTLDASIAAQQQMISQAEQQIATGQVALASLHSEASAWAALGLAVPAKADIPNLLRMLQQTTDANHVSMQSITLGGSSSSATQTSSATTASSSAATSVPIQLSFTGGYQALANLIKTLEGLVTVSGGTVNATGPLLSVSSMQLSGSSTLTAQVSATIYQLPAASASSGTTTTPTDQ